MWFALGWLGCGVASDAWFIVKGRNPDESGARSFVQTDWKVAAVFLVLGPFSIPLVLLGVG